jgi:hypothetical protein
MGIKDASAQTLDACRNAMQTEQTRSLQATNNWSHVDKAQTHADWDAFYKVLAPLVGVQAPESAEVQALMAQHYALASRFYTPSRDAYIGMGLFYSENPAMRDFHNTYHPHMVEFLGDAVYAYAMGNLG